MFIVRILTERARTRDPAGYSPQDAGSGPRHAFEKSSPVDAVGIMVVNNSLDQDSSPLKLR
jgi:hypothetical protein